MAVALVVVHVSVAELPAVIVAGEAERFAVGAGGACTVTVAAAVAVPPPPVAVNVYWVVAAGLTVTDPEAATVPTPLLMETVLAFVVVHVKVADAPAVTLAGDAERVAVGVGAVDDDVDELLPHPERSPIQTQAARTGKYLFDKQLFSILKGPSFTFKWR